LPSVNSTCFNCTNNALIQAGSQAAEVIKHTDEYVLKIENYIHNIHDKANITVTSKKQYVKKRQILYNNPVD